MTVVRVSFAVLVVTVIAAGLYFQQPSHDDIWRFNFAPDTAPGIDAFINVDAAADYSGWRGYGWLDTVGSLETGRWPGDSDTRWESRNNLNVIMRRSPDALAQGFASGPATFALDVEPGTYEVWVLSGDAGHLEHVPRDAYRILVEGQTLYDFAVSLEDFIQAFETPVSHDQLTYDDIWAQSVAPRFVWRRAVVDVQDGQLTVSMTGKPRDGTLAAYMGDYAHTEARGGPATRYAGALNALIVVPHDSRSDKGARLVEAVDGWRRASIRENWPQQPLPARQPVELTAADHERGYTAYPVNVLTQVLPNEMRSHHEELTGYRATPGETVAITFAVTPLTDLGDTRVEMVLHDVDDMNRLLPDPDDLDYGVVRYVPRSMKNRVRRWQPRPAMIIPVDHWDIHKDVTKQFWLSYRIPDDLPAGHYSGYVGIQPAHGQASRLKVELEVLPFRLQRPTHLAIGMTYFSPAQYAAIGEEAFWARIGAEFADMRAHNMTTVQYTGIHMDDYERMDRAMSLYREAGFEQPIDLLESYGAMTRLRRLGVAWETEEFQAVYVQFIRDFLGQAQARGWPPIIINFGDEFTNRGIETFGARVARNLRQIPGIVTAADVNGYKEMTLLAPEVDILAFNQGWDGPRRVNSGKRMLNRETVEEVLAAGAKPWLVNIGMDRFSNGFWLWKMVRLGVRGKVEWMYRGYNGMPYDSFDADPLRIHAVYPGPDGAAIPSLEYERMRIGLDDLAYLNTLESLVSKSRDDLAKAPAVSAARAFISRLDGMINDDMTVYRDSEQARHNRWPVDRYNMLRDEVIELILSLQSPALLH